jgi:hypothetical protein
VETVVHRTAFALLIALAACHNAPRGSDATGAPTPALAVERFLGSAKAQDLQAMSTFWGSARGAARDVTDRSQLERRELIMMCYLTHDTYKVQSEGPAQGGKRAYVVELRRGTIARSTTVITVLGPASRWYVEDVKLEPLTDLCQNQQSAAPAPRP